MKSLLILTLPLILSGCVLLWVPHYDQTEYQTIVQIGADAALSACAPQETDKLVDTAAFLYVYTKHEPHNEKMHEAADKLYQVIRRLSNRVHSPEGVTEAACRLKLDVILEITDTMAKASGGKLR